MKIYSLDVRKDIIEPKNIVVPSGNAKLHQLQFAFDEAWNGLPKVCVFTKSGTEYSVALENDACVIPSDMAIEPGSFSLGLYGYDADGETLVVRISTNKLTGLIVDGAYTGTDDEVTPTLYEQLGAALERHKNDKDNPHEVTAEQVGTYDKNKIDKELLEKTDSTDFLRHANNIANLHPNAVAGAIEIDESFDLTKTAECVGGDVGVAKIESNKLRGGGNTFDIKFVGEAEIEIYADSFLCIYINRDPVVSVDYQDTFKYSGNIESLSVYVSAGSAIFNRFAKKTYSSSPGFMSSEDKAKMDGLPNEVYSKDEVDAQITTLQEDVAETNSALDAVGEEIGGLNERVELLKSKSEDDVNALLERVAKVESDITQSESKLDEVSSAVSAVQEVTNNNTASITALQTRADETDAKIGSIDTALDSILAIQTALLGGESA